MRTLWWRSWEPRRPARSTSSAMTAGGGGGGGPESGAPSELAKSGAGRRGGGGGAEPCRAVASCMRRTRAGPCQCLTRRTPRRNCLSLQAQARLWIRSWLSGVGRRAWRQSLICLQKRTTSLLPHPRMSRRRRRRRRRCGQQRVQAAPPSLPAPLPALASPLPLSAVRRQAPQRQQQRRERGRVRGCWTTTMMQRGTTTSRWAPIGPLGRTRTCSAPTGPLGRTRTRLCTCTFSPPAPISPHHRPHALSSTPTPAGGRGDWRAGRPSVRGVRHTRQGRLLLGAARPRPVGARPRRRCLPRGRHQGGRV